MREVKFRAYDKRNNRVYDVISIEWSYGDILRKYLTKIPNGEWLPHKVSVLMDNGKTRLFSYYPTGKTYMRPFPNSNKRHIYSYGVRDLHDLTLLEFTGLKDKKGVDIYEGNIVEWYNFSNERQVKIVAWSEERAGFLPNDLTKDPIVEVIGNIYEHKHLLEKI